MNQNERKEKKIARFYVMGETGLTITDSQVFNWMEVMKRSGYPTSIISFVSEPDKKLDFDKINQRTGGQYYQYQNKNAFFSFIYFYKIFRKHYLDALKTSDKVIFQTRTSGVALSLLLLKYLTRAKIIYDARGLSIEEYKHVNKGRKMDYKRAFKFNLLKLNEWLMIRKANHVFSVSNLQQQYYLEKYTGVQPSRFEVVPCAADNNDFYFDENERMAKRKEYNITDETVLLYSGRLYTGWAVPDQIFNFFRELTTKFHNAILFVLTPDIEIAKKMQVQFGISEEKIRIAGVSYHDVRKYLNMADFGILLREDTLMNNIAAPTKVAEYMLCGLPLIISANVREVSDVVKENSFGAVVHNYRADDEVVRIISQKRTDRQKIAEWADANLSKSCFVEKIIKTYQEL